MGKNIILLVIFVLTYSFSPFYVFAQTFDSNGVEVRRAIPVNTNSQGSQYLRTGGQASGGGSNGATTDFAADAVGCSAGQILGNIVQAGVSGVINSITGSATNYVVDAAGTVIALRVPTQDADTPSIRNDTAAQRAKDAGGGNPTLFGAIGQAFSISWDSIGFCLANATIHYVAQSTINWINSGFEGNPAFVDNPGQFFQDVADTEAGGFIEGAGLGFLCSEFAPKVRIALVNDYLRRTGGDPYEDRAKCSFDNAQNNLQNFLDDYKQGGLSNYVEFVFNPANRAQSAYLQAQDELNIRLNRQKAELNMELNWGRGFLSIKDCTNAPSKVVNGKTVKDTSKCQTKSPGQVIQGQLESTLNIPKDRLAIADEFDEVVAALVNYLIKTALSETLTNDDRAGQYGTSGSEDNSDLGDSYYNPPTNPGNPSQPGPRPFTLTCRANKAQAVASHPVDGKVVFTAIPSGYASTGMYFEWFSSASLLASTTENHIELTFPTPGESDVSVAATAGNRSVSVRCPIITVLAASSTPDTNIPPVASSTTSINITSPNGGERINIGQNFAVTWTGSNIPKGAVMKISLSDGASSAVLKTLNTIPTNRKTNIVIPAGVVLGNYKLKVDILDKPCNGGGYCGEKLLSSDRSDNFFTVTAPLVATCEANRTIVQAGLPVIWSVSASGGLTSNFSYLWTGSDSLNNATGSSVTLSYSTKGKKSGSVKVTNGTDTITKNCGNLTVN